MSRVWAHRQSGTLHVQPSRHNKRTYALQVSQGGLVSGVGFQNLNAALRAGTVRFVVHPSDKAGAWEATGSFLFSRAKKAAMRAASDTSLPPSYQFDCDPEVLHHLCGLPLGVLLHPHENGGAHQVTRRALVMMGLLSAGPVKPRLVEDTQPVTIGWSALDLQAIINTAAPTPALPHHLLEQLPQLIHDGQHSQARAMAESALLKHMGHGPLCLWLAIAWLSDETLVLSARVDSARQWITPADFAEIAALDGAKALQVALREIYKLPALHRLSSAQRRWLRQLRSAQPEAPRPASEPISRRPQPSERCN